LSAAEGGSGLRPLDLRDAYFPGEEPRAPTTEPQTIALVDAYNDPSVATDLAVYDTEFGLPACTTANGCLSVVNQRGENTSLPFPSSRRELETALNSLNGKRREEAEEAGGWAVEISTDVQMARAICNANCKIVLVEASSPAYANLEAAEEAAVKLGATEISNSWGGEEPSSDARAFEHAGVVITASSGDEGYRNWTEAAQAGEGNYYAGIDYPASSPHVVAVGGTKLMLAGGARQSETVWNEDPDPGGENHGAGGGGCSEHFAAPSWQLEVPDWSAIGCGTSRAVADVAADADPYTGVAVYDSTPDEEGAVLRWAPIGGTSVASPLLASMFALGGGSHGVAYPAQTLYSHLGASLLYDVTSGGNGQCRDEYSGCAASSDPLLDCGGGALICNASHGFDGPTGVGAPESIDAFELAQAPSKGGEPTGELGKEESKSEEPPKEEVKSEPPGSKGGGSEEPGGKPVGGEGGGGSGGETREGAGGKQPGGGSPEAPANPTRSSPTSLTFVATKASAPSGSAPTRAARISALALTSNARAALRRARPGFADVAFSFKLSRATSVRATLGIRVGPSVRRRWRALPASLTLAAVRGLNRRRLPTIHALAPGLYRLTLAPRGGAARSIAFRVP
jgi:hypothetical protein